MTRYQSTNHILITLIPDPLSEILASRPNERSVVRDLIEQQVNSLLAEY